MVVRSYRSLSAPTIGYHIITRTTTKRHALGQPGGPGTAGPNFPKTRDKPGNGSWSAKDPRYMRHNRFAIRPDCYNVSFFMCFAVSVRFRVDGVDIASSRVRFYGHGRCARLRTLIGCFRRLILSLCFHMNIGLSVIWNWIRFSLSFATDLFIFYSFINSTRPPFRAYNS